MELAPGSCSLQADSLSLGGIYSQWPSAGSGIISSTGPPGAVVVSHFGAVAGPLLHGVDSWIVLASCVDIWGDID